MLFFDEIHLPVHVNNESLAAEDLQLDYVVTMSRVHRIMSVVDLKTVKCYQSRKTWTIIIILNGLNKTNESLSGALLHIRIPNCICKYSNEGIVYVWTYQSWIQSFSCSRSLLISSFHWCSSILMWLEKKLLRRSACTSTGIQCKLKCEEERDPAPAVSVNAWNFKQNIQVAPGLAGLSGA